MALWEDDPFDALLHSLERAVPPPATDAAPLPTLAEMQDDLCGLIEFVGVALFSSDPEALGRAEADPRLQRALANCGLTVRPD